MTPDNTVSTAIQTPKRAREVSLSAARCSLVQPVFQTPGMRADSTGSQKIELKGQGHVTVNKPVVSIICIVSHTWPLRSAQILMDEVNPQKSCIQKPTNISAIVQHMSVSFVSLRGSRVHLQNNTFILRKIVENLSDMAYQKYCKIVISKEVCLHCVTLPL